MKTIDADALNEELDTIAKRADFGEMALIPIRDFRILMNRAEMSCSTLDSHSQECDGANCHMKPIEKWFMRRLETMVCRILSREGKAPTADNVTRFLKDALDEFAEERCDDYYMGS